MSFSSFAIINFKLILHARHMHLCVCFFFSPTHLPPPPPGGGGAGGGGRAGGGGGGRGGGAAPGAGAPIPTKSTFIFLASTNAEASGSECSMVTFEGFVPTPCPYDTISLLL